MVSHEDAFTAMEYARRMERFHCLDGIRDGRCPCCGAPVDVLEGPQPGELSAHGTEISADTVRLRWRGLHL